MSFNNTHTKQQICSGAKTLTETCIWKLKFNCISTLYIFYMCKCFWEIENKISLMCLLIYSYTLFTNHCMPSSFQITIFFISFLCVVFLCNSRIFVQGEGVWVLCYRCEVQCVCVCVCVCERERERESPSAEASFLVQIGFLWYKRMNVGVYCSKDGKRERETCYVRDDIQS